MVGTTSDRNDPRLGHGVDDAPVPQNETYLVLADTERAKGFVRPYRDSYRHVGPTGPVYPLRDLTLDEHERYDDYGYVKYEEYLRDVPAGASYPSYNGPATGRFWTQAQLDSVGKGCGAITTMGRSIAETYARNPHFYGSTYCVGCQMHRGVGEHGEFVWLDGTRVGS